MQTTDNREILDSIIEKLQDDRKGNWPYVWVSRNYSKLDLIIDLKRLRL